MIVLCNLDLTLIKNKPLQNIERAIKHTGNVLIKIVSHKEYVIYVLIANKSIKPKSLIFIERPPKKIKPFTLDFKCKWLVIFGTFTLALPT